MKKIRVGIKSVGCIVLVDTSTNQKRYWSHTWVLYVWDKVRVQRVVDMKGGS